jgi:hypothetical protein
VCICNHILNTWGCIVITYSPHQCFSTALLQHISVPQQCQLKQCTSVKTTEVQSLAECYAFGCVYTSRRKLIKLFLFPQNF